VTFRYEADRSEFIDRLSGKRVKILDRVEKLVGVRRQEMLGPGRKPERVLAWSLVCTLPSKRQEWPEPQVRRCRVKAVCCEQSCCAWRKEGNERAI
jgi:hypothetical protein